MRPIKFRAWDKNVKIMRDADWLSEIRLGYILTDATLELLQFTGLLDKNGIEIYEGDILLDEDHGQAERYRGPVVWQVYEFVVRYKNLRNKTWTQLTYEAEPVKLHWEVVGNIYENPNLLAS